MPMVYTYATYIPHHPHMRVRTHKSGSRELWVKSQDDNQTPFVYKMFKYSVNVIIYSNFPEYYSQRIK